VDFAFADRDEQPQYRIQAMFLPSGDPKLTFCDVHARGVVCATSHPNEALRFPEQDSRYSGPGEGQRLAARYLALDPVIGSLLPTTNAWVAAAQTRSIIFGQPYADFVKKQLMPSAGFPVQDAGRMASVKFTMSPASAKNPTSGTVSFTSPPDPSFMKCFSCDTVECMNTGVTYKFADRFLYLTRVTPGQPSAGKTTTATKPSVPTSANQDGEPIGAGWIILASEPYQNGKPAWRYICGVSRYSLQTIGN